MATVNAGKVSAGAYADDDLIINDTAVDALAFEDDDAGGGLCAALSAAGVDASVVGGDLILTATGDIMIVGCVPWGTTTDRQPAVPGIVPGLYT